MRTLIAVPRTVATLIVSVLCTIVAAIAVLIIARARPDHPWIDRLIRIWARTWLAMSGTRVDVMGRENVDPACSYVVVANHLSNFDIMVCFVALPIPIRYLAKKELFRIPLLAPAMRAVGIVQVDRQARGTGLDSINRQAQAVIARGQSLIIFPEGTRSRDGEPRPFKKGAFTMALMARMPVLPVTIQGTYEVWRPHRPLIYGGRVQVVVDPPIEVDGLDRKDGERVRTQAEGIIHSRFEDLRRESLPSR